MIETNSSLILCLKEVIPPMDRYTALEKYFGYKSFRPGQEVLIDALLKGRDVLGVMPTGAGKSLCYQIPALLLPGITLVISPLISLMQDQVQALEQAGIPAAYINSSLSPQAFFATLDAARKGSYKLLYVAPERLETELFRSFAQEAEISLVAVDEAHCISQWGQDFRPSYTRILDFLEFLPRRPVVGAFTATATQQVQEDILDSLQLQDPQRLVTGFDRANLYFGVERPRSKDEFVLAYLKRHPEDSGIIYCSTRKNVDELYSWLQDQHFSVGRYHAGLSQEERQKAQEDFLYDRTPVIIATNAFGMGIDKSNVRYVLHYNMPSCLENYYQEAGRAGRDGEPSECILLYAAQDVMIQKFLLEHKDQPVTEELEEVEENNRRKLSAMEQYCTTTACLRMTMLHYFGEEAPARCDNCSSCNGDFQEIDITEQTKAIVKCIHEAGHPYGMNLIANTLAGSHSTRVEETGLYRQRLFGALHQYTLKEIKEMIRCLIEQGYLLISPDKYPVLRISKKIWELQDTSIRVLLRKAQAPEADSGSSRRRSAELPRVSLPEGFTREQGEELFSRLRALRKKLAEKAMVPPFVIFGDRTLRDMCRVLPRNHGAFLTVLGVGQAKDEKYGDAFLDVIKDFCQENNL